MKKDAWRSVWLIWMATSALLLSGCQLAHTQWQEEQASDQLIGMYITRDHLDLFDMESYLEDHKGQLLQGDGRVLGEGESRAYENRVYAVYQETGEYVFEELEGICFFLPQRPEQEDAVSIQADPEMSDIECRVSDQGQEIEGTIYCRTEGNVIFYFNPVYQTAEGAVYLLSGTGISGNLTDGASFHQRMEEERTVSANGRKETESMAVTVTVCGQEAFDRHIIAEMNAQDEKIGETVWAAEELPEKVTVDADAAYLLCTSRREGSERAERQVVELTEEGSSFFVFAPGENGVSIRKEIAVEKRKER